MVKSQYCHATWEEFDDLPEAEKKLIKRQIEHQLKETAEQTEKEEVIYQVSWLNLISKLT